MPGICWLAVGVMVGGFIGVLAAGLCCAAGSDEERDSIGVVERETADD